MLRVSRPWNHLAAIVDQQVLLPGRVKEVIVPQIEQMDQRQQSALLLARPLIFPLRHTQTTHRENAGGGHRVHTGVLQIQMVNDT